MDKTQTATRRWPLWLIASSAAVSIWVGWVGLGQMCGFGLVHPLPGIADRITLNSAITLPVGMEAYSAYAIGAWLSPRTRRTTARTFAKRSALTSLLLGLLGQAIYHLLTAFGHTTAPWPVVLFVAALPVLVLGAGATLHHLLTEDPNAIAPPNQQPEEAATETAKVSDDIGLPVVAPPPAVHPVRRRPKAKRPAGRRLKADFLAEARAALAQSPGIDPSPAWCRTVTGCSQRLSTDLARELRTETHTGDPSHANGASTKSSANDISVPGMNSGTSTRIGGRDSAEQEAA